MPVKRTPVPAKAEPTSFVLHGDCLAHLPTLPENSFDSVVTDPPYGLSFMGKDWDHGVPGEHFWKEVLRVAKPGAHLVAFGGTRTYHRLAVAIEDAGWEIRDCLMWLYGTGFPKSLDVSKSIDAVLGAERKVIGYDASRARPNRVGKVLGEKSYDRSDNGATLTAPGSEEAAAWEGWGTALKPGWEPIILARKPLVGTVATNVLEYGTGALNIDATRIGYTSDTDKASATPQGKATARSGRLAGKAQGGGERAEFERPELKGRWPANVVLDEEAGAQLGEVSRFFYCPKASASEREAGLDDMPRAQQDETREPDAPGANNPRNRGGGARANNHPTVKPLPLMRWLLTLTTPPGGFVLDPFAGSGTTGVACKETGLRFAGIELDERYCEIARRRIAAATLGSARGDAVQASP